MIRHELYPSVEAMLLPAAMSEIDERRIAAVRQVPLETVGGVSGTHLSRVEVADEQGHTRRYVLKRFSREWDWIMRTTDDRCGRELAVWTAGVLDELPPGLGHAIVAGARDGDGWAVLMHDVSATFPPADPFAPLTADDHTRLLDALASLHAAFWGRSDLHSLPVCWTDLQRHYALLTPATARCEAGASDELAFMAVGWAAFPDVVEPAVATLVRALQDDPQPLCAALARYPQTLIHGDYKLANIGVRRTTSPSRIILLDWALVGFAPPAVDLAWYLGLGTLRLPATKEEAIEHYRQSLATKLGAIFDASWWQPQLTLALLGGVLRFGYWLAWLATQHPREDLQTWAREELRWWSAYVYAAMPLL